MRNFLKYLLVAGVVLCTASAIAPSFAQTFNGEKLSENSDISLAIIANDIPTVEKLLKAGLDPMKPTRFEHPRWFQGKPTDFQPIMAASLFGRTEILKLFYTAGKVDKINPVTFFILCTTLIWGNEPAALYLIEQGAMVNPPGGCVGRGGPLDLATFNNLPAVVASLTKAGARSMKP